MKSISPQSLKEKLDQRAVLLLDVREPAEHDLGFIEGSFLLPLSQVSFEKLPSLSLPIVVHCRSGMRSEEACRKLLDQDPSLDLYLLEGGLEGWKGCGYPLKVSSQKWSLERQAELLVGGLCLLGTVLGILVEEDFFIFPGLVGLGLMISAWAGAGKTARFLSKMPWNR